MTANRIFCAASALTLALLLGGCGKVDLTMKPVTPEENDISDISQQSEISDVSSADSKTAEPADESSAEDKPVYGDDFVNCTAAICYDLTEDEIIYAKNADKRIYPASTTKLLTALTAIEYTAPEYIYYVGSELDMVEQDSSMSWISYGSSLQRNAILAAMLTPSGNDAAYTIAVNVARKIYGENLSDKEAADYFCALMTDYAKKLGAENTNFTVPDGYHDENHYTTASDMLKIAIAATQSKTILDITSQPLVIVYDEQGEVHSWKNGNILLEDTTLPYTVIGLKNGFTDEAGFCFIGYAEMDGKEIITLTFNCDLEYRFSDTKKLMDLGFGLYDSDYNYYESY